MQSVSDQRKEFVPRPVFGTLDGVRPAPAESSGPKEQEAALVCLWNKEGVISFAPNSLSLWVVLQVINTGFTLDNSVLRNFLTDDGWK